jgi:ABC-2 type transport system ATP-binding protein
VKAGRVVASGPVSDLRMGRHRQLAVQVDDGGDHRWVHGLDGVRVRAAADGTTGWVLELDDAVDDQTVLDAARTAGPVRRFGPFEPSLTDLFREVVEA